MAITNDIIRQHKIGAINWRERRLPEWNETYRFYRQRVEYNRLTQRQTVMIPLMKTIIKTLMKDINEAPSMYFNCLDNDEMKEKYYNLLFRHHMKENKMILKDMVDKKNVLLFGRSFKKQTIENGKYKFYIVPPEDFIVDRYIDPSDIDSGDFYSQLHIYVSLSELEKRTEYNQDVVKKIKTYYASTQGLVKQEQIKTEMIERSNRMRDLGVDDVDNPELGETYIELNDIWMYDINSKGERVMHYVVQSPIDDIEYEAEHGKIDTVLLCKPLSDVLDPKGRCNGYWDNHVPVSSWADDVESTDFWSDGVGDTVRGSATIMNSWFSSEVENRTLKNFNMHYYNSATSEEFIPQTFNPEPWGWYPVPGNPRDLVFDVEVPDLNGNLESINLVKSFAEQASGATAASQGQTEQRQVTLGEVQLTLGEAKARVRGMAIFYMESWEDFGNKYIKILEGNPEMLDDVTVTKKGRLGKKMHTKSLSPEDWMAENGYTVEVKQVVDKSQEDAEQIQKLIAVQNFMPNNQPLKTIIKEKMIDFAGLTLEEKLLVMDYERSMEMQALEQSMMLPEANGAVEGEVVPPQQVAPQQLPTPTM